MGSIPSLWPFQDLGDSQDLRGVIRNYVGRCGGTRGEKRKRKRKKEIKGRSGGGSKEEVVVVSGDGWSTRVLVEEQRSDREWNGVKGPKKTEREGGKICRYLRWS